MLMYGTNIEHFRSSQFTDVRRTYEEFAKLWKHLTISNPECLVPPLPPSITSAGLGLEEETKYLHIRMQKWFDLISESPLLIQDKELVYFTEGHFGYSPVIPKNKHGSVLKRKAIKMQAAPPDDTPELCNLRPVIKQFYRQTSESSAKLEKVIKTLRVLSSSEDELGLKFITIADMEQHSGMSNAFRKLGKTVQSISHSRLNQANIKAVIFIDTLSYISSDAFVVEETLMNRQILIKELLSAQTSSRSKISAITRLKSSNSKPEKVDEVLASLEKTRSHEQNLNIKLTRITTNLLQEGRKWIKRTSNDIMLSLKEYTKRQIECERRMLAILESSRPDIRNVDHTGGLSRLGREFSRLKNRNDINSSQTAQGDAWSGIQRQKNHIKEYDSKFLKRIDDVLDARSAFETLGTKVN
ncbi:hypothetical protein MERGE_000156 [Pneumocystis wakefieldiae]|uniref:PX domain-containing protein n=1 Tax=Pneumocystis wakefieldiae TaxID=38082 RepID=A0A899FZD0_9ASCO|nr:hypothetical protein MERGE_000156 [Pneumocystis wakefieldiae]